MSLIPQNVPNTAHQTRYDALVWFIVGQPMTGKSTFANSFPDALLLNTDGNYFQFETPSIFIDKNGVDYNGARYNPWEYFKNVIAELNANPQGTGYKTLILDLLEDLYEMARLYVIGIHRKKHESEIGGGYGQGYKLVEDEFISVIQQAANLRNHGWNVIMLSHQKIENVKTIDEKVVDTQYGSALRSKVQDKIKGISHIAGRTDKITTVVETGQGPVKNNEFVLNINEPQSIASNRLSLPFDKIYLSYEGWRNAIASITTNGN